MSPSELAYIIYTSGSTGTPKGVAIEHRALANLVEWHRGAYRLGRDDRASHVSSFSFDASVWETWATLAAGATLVIADGDTRRDPDRLIAWLAAEQVTVSFLPTPLAEEVLRRPDAATLSLRYLLTGGDRLRTRPPRGLPFQVVNHYGPTENAVVATAGIVRADGDCPPDIGRPITNNQVYLLDSHRQPVPIGVTGEIYIGGRSLARSYYRRPDLTEERFVPHPFSDEPGARLFRTGDLARWNRDGTLAFIGRNDRQIKVRGVRIEPAEIEAALSRDPSVARVVVVPRDDAPGGTRLVAYVTAVSGLAADEVARRCRAAAAARLPEYMIPSAFEALDAMPLTAHGKIDIAALPPPAEVATPIASPAGGTETPASVTEEALVAIWKDVLRLESVPLDASFFSDFGGHSLLAVALIGRIRERLQVELPLRAVFEAPTVRLLAAHVERAHPIAAASWAIPRRLVRDTAPCSFAQRRLWFLDRLTPGGSFYNIPTSLRLRTALDPTRLQQSLDVLVARHEVLRTTIRTVDGEPVQHIAPGGTVSISFEDLQHLPSEEREAEAARRASVEARQPFDLEVGPLARVTLIRLAPDDAVLLTTLHHIICDGASLDLLFREWTAVYQALEQGETPDLPELRFQFGDYAEWQRRHLTGGGIEIQRRYWTERLAGSSPLALPTDRPRPALASYAGSHARMHLGAAATSGLKALAADEGVTLFMTVAAALQVLLARYAGQDDVAIGTIAAGRQQPELQHVIGLFVNTLVLRTDLGGNPTFRVLLHRVKEVALGAYAHADVPFEQVVEALQPERDLSRHPLVQVMLQVFGGASRPDSGARPLDGDRGVSTFDLALDLWEREDGLDGRLEYSTDLFEAATIDRMLRHLETLLEAAALDRDRPIASLPMLSASELADLERCNDTARHYPAAAGVHRIVAARCDRVPDAPACVGEDGVVTYGELRQRVRAIHALLASHGVRRGDVVAVSLPRGSTWVASLLAIFEAGAVLLPLDPSWPEARQLELMRDAGALRLLAEGGRAATLPADVAVLDPANAPAPATVVESPAGEPTDLAYVLYTSGSTGRPKGVAIEHRSLLNHAHAIIDRFDLGCADRVLQFAPVSFDVSLEEVLPTLAAGATVVFRPGAHAPSGPALVAHMASSGVTVANLPAAYWHHWVDELEAAPPPPCLRLVIVGSETVDADRVVTWRTRHPNRPRLVNAYGTTETTITSLTWEVDAHLTHRDVPIGRPLANVTCHLLDRHLQPVPAGVAADLYIGGVGVARGYIGREPLDLVASPAGAERLYRTGDRARRREDGAVVYVGRSDGQLKVRGHRVEPAEIVAELRACAGVRDAVVRQLGDRVIAYVTGPDTVAESEVLSQLRGRLPFYMVPSAIVQLSAIPVDAHGKTRLLDLPAPGPRAVAIRDDRLTTAERLVSRIWEDALETSQPPLDANFFELGGHSLLLLRVHSRLERAVGRTIAVVELFRHPTIASLARFLSADAPSGPLAAPPPDQESTASTTQVAS